jgi:general secretion pathway protein D
MAVLAAAALVSACQSTPPHLDLAVNARPANNLSKSIPPQKISTTPRLMAAKAFEELDAGNFEKASKLLNTALKLDIRNSYLQFFNALVYHLRGLQGDPSLLALAEEGYKIAIRFDPTNTYARYYLGLLYLDQRKYERAQSQLADAALYSAEDPDLLYNLAVASYYNRDPVTAAATLGRLRGLKIGKERRQKILRASSVVMASLGDTSSASTYLGEYRDLGAAPEGVSSLSRRIKSWKNFHARVSGTQLAQSGGNLDQPSEGAPSEETQGAGAEGSEGLPSEFVNKQMVVVDVVLIGTEEDLNTSKGINLLSGLEIQFGAAGGTPAFSFQRDKTRSNIDGTTLTRSVKTLIQVPAITYSLNIANSLTERNEILARPTLVAQVGKQSEFFSGVEINAAAVSGGDGSSVSIQKEVGVKLTVTPEFLDRDTVALQVSAQRRFLTNPSASVVFDFRLDTTKTEVNANVVMKFGETLILSGLSEKEFESNRDGVPILQDIPFAQYLFAKATTRKFRKSVMILITPRRPAYTYQDEKTRKETLDELSGKDRAIYEFESKYSDWYRPYPSWASVFHQLKENQLYREFRTGDVEMEAWNSNQSVWDRLRGALRFIYY